MDFLQYFQNKFLVKEGKFFGNCLKATLDNMSGFCKHTIFTRPSCDKWEWIFNFFKDNLQGNEIIYDFDFFFQEDLLVNEYTCIFSRTSTCK